jgi:hypothetical protein
MEKYINEVKAICDEIRGAWNGDESGRLEDRANIAQDISEKCDEILELIKEL